MAAEPTPIRVSSPDTTDATRPNPHALLKQIGDDLDRGRTLVVYRGGEVWPSAGRPDLTELGSSEGVIKNGPDDEEPPGSGGSAAEQGQGAAGDGAAGSRASHAVASLLRDAGVAHDVEHDLVEATEAYPRMRPRLASPGVWLDGVVRPVHGMRDAASIRVVYPLDLTLPVRAWAWWSDGVWIGPRHTNYGDGSICGYEPSDGVWDRSLPLVRLLDIYAGWITRHLYLRVFGRWPGAQVLHTPYERLTEHRPGERCGRPHCAAKRTYESCCMPKDKALNWKEVEGQFRALYPNPVRRAPANALECQRFASQRPLSPAYYNAARAIQAGRRPGVARSSSRAERAGRLR